jgi:hypothetical protein
MISRMAPLRKERETLDGCPGWLRAIGSGLGWIIFLPWTIYDWAESTLDEKVKKNLSHGVSSGLDAGAHGEEGCLVALVRLIVFVCFLPFWLVQWSVELSRIGESPIEWETRRMWFTVGFWLSVILIAWLIVHEIGVFSQHKEDAYEPSGIRFEIALPMESSSRWLLIQPGFWFAER